VEFSEHSENVSGVGPLEHWDRGLELHLRFSVLRCVGGWITVKGVVHRISRFITNPLKASGNYL
jgi:hypothetical protein